MNLSSLRSFRDEMSKIGGFDLSGISPELLVKRAPVLPNTAAPTPLAKQASKSAKEKVDGYADVVRPYASSALSGASKGGFLVGLLTKNPRKVRPLVLAGSGAGAVLGVADKAYTDLKPSKGPASPNRKR